MGHVTARRGRVDGMGLYGNSQIVRAYVPLAEMSGYATTLRSATQGRGTLMMVFDHYEDVPKSVQEEIIKKILGEAIRTYKVKVPAKVSAFSICNFEKKII